jgi:hypothetical protein
VGEADTDAVTDGDFESETEELADADEVTDLLRTGVLLIYADILDDDVGAALREADGDELGKDVRVTA